MPRSPDVVQSLSAAELLRLWEPVLHHVSDGVVVSDARQPDHPVLLVNRAFERITGYSEAEVRGRNCRFLQGEDRKQPAIVMLREALREERPVRVVLRNYRKDGELFWNETTLLPVRDDRGTVVYYLGILRDVTIQHRAEEQRLHHEALRDSEERFRQIVEHLDDAVWLTEAGNDRPLYTNAACKRIWGHTAEEPEAGDWMEAVHPEDRSRFGSLSSPPAESAGDDPVELEFRVMAGDGSSQKWLRARSFPIRDAAGRVVRRVGIAQDVTAHRQVQEQLRRTNDALATTVQELARRNLQMLALNETVDHLQGCATWREAEAALEECVPEVFPQESGGLYLMNPERPVLEPLVVWGNPASPDRSFSPESCQALRRGREFWTSTSHPSERCDHYPPQPDLVDICLSLRSQNRALGLLHLRIPADSDQTQDLKASVLRFAVNAAEQIAVTLSNIQLRETLHTQAIQDPLTGLYNRRFFNGALERELRRSARRETPLGVLMIDLDHFKRVNDERGHEAGDHLLRAVAEMLRSSVRAEDVIARYGGEEFIVLLPDTNLAEARILAERLRRGFKKLEVQYGDRPLDPMTLSVGVAASPDSGTTAEALVQAADSALYRAKREGRDRVVLDARDSQHSGTS